MSEEGEVRLAAVMFTDIVGYSGMMEADEQRTIDIIEKHNGILFPLVDSFNGRIVDAIGDGLLLTFSSVFSAYTCAVNIQKAIGSHNQDAPDDQRFLLRIGIHLGDIWFSDERIFGNGVNIAARILPFSLPGGICISGEVYNQIQNKLKTEIEDLGTQQVKNIQRPVRLYRVRTGCEEAGGADDVSAEETADRADMIAELLKRERNNLSGRQGKDAGTQHSADGKSGSFEDRLTNRIYGFVENVLDRALDKWESIPQEKKEAAVQALKKEKWYSDEEEEDRPLEAFRSDEESKEEKDDPRELLGVGTAASLGFGAALAYFGSFWLIFPLIFIGLIPLGIGITKLIKPERTPPVGSQSQERRIILAAREHKGRLTAMQAAADSDLSIDEAQAVLEDMAKKGHISQEIDAKGSVFYIFPDFI
jgi:class 3 adenylate cyclase